MKTASIEIDSPSDPEVCTIVVLYDGNLTRARAMAACDYLVNQFWADIELSFHWWRTDFLRDAALAQVAADDAVKSDFLIICSESGGEFSPALESWFEIWLDRRGEREGALMDLSSSLRSPQREIFLREVGRRGKFDYLTAVPGEGGNPLNPNGAGPEKSGHLEEIPVGARPPSHYGLNE